MIKKVTDAWDLNPSSPLWKPTSTPLRATANVIPTYIVFQNLVPINVFNLA